MVWGTAHVRADRTLQLAELPHLDRIDDERPVLGVLGPRRSPLWLRVHEVAHGICICVVATSETVEVEGSGSGKRTH